MERKICKNESLWDLRHQASLSLSFLLFPVQWDESSTLVGCSQGSRTPSPSSHSLGLWYLPGRGRLQVFLMPQPCSMLQELYSRHKQLRGLEFPLSTQLPLVGCMSTLVQKAENSNYHHPSSQTFHFRRSKLLHGWIVMQGSYSKKTGPNFWWDWIRKTREDPITKIRNLRGDVTTNVIENWRILRVLYTTVY